MPLFTPNTVEEICRQVQREQGTEWYFYPNGHHPSVWLYLNGESWTDAEEWWDRAFRYIFGTPHSAWESHSAVLMPWYEAFCLVKHSIVEEAIKKTPKSQKAIGIHLLSTFASSKFSCYAPAFYHLPNEDVKKIAAKETIPKLYVTLRKFRDSEFKVFARPCPVRPRHGFVDSRKVELRQLRDLRPICLETLKADPEGELIIMKPIDSGYSMIANSKAIVVGRGNDGSTSGKNALTLGIAKTWQWAPHQKEQLHIKPEEDVFAEFVTARFDASYAYLTQLRGGPAIPATANYVPRDIFLDRQFLIEALKEDGSERSLLEWEELIAKLQEKPDWQNYYVWHLGGAISSHYGVHCFLKTIPYFTTAIEFNKWEKANFGAKPEFISKAAFRRGVEKSHFVVAHRNVDYHLGVEQLHFILAGLHNFPALDPLDEKQIEFFGMAVGTAIKLGLAAILGELRYGRRVESGQCTVDGVHIPNSIQLRSQIYQRALDNDLNYVLRKAFRTAPHYGMDPWILNHSVGGRMWLECSRAVFDLWNRTCDLANSGAYSDLVHLTEKLNYIINVCHNGSQLLSKFASTTHFDYGANWPQRNMLKLAPKIYDLICEKPGPKVAFEKFTLDPEVWEGEEVYRRRYGKSPKQMKEEQEESSDDCNGGECGECGAKCCSNCGECECEDSDSCH